MQNIPLILVFACISYAIVCAISDYYNGDLWITPKNKK